MKTRIVTHMDASRLVPVYGIQVYTGRPSDAFSEILSRRGVANGEARRIDMAESRTRIFLTT